ncbi:hypothetical protein INTERNEXUS_69 [Bacillus phage vB_BspM_Internexus]|nr:hypothetical protein INTERNEXUS_69 [Bacillus phage vB_BspM_Internexus]
MLMITQSFKFLPYLNCYIQPSIMFPYRFGIKGSKGFPAVKEVLIGLKHFNPSSFLKAPCK